MSLLGEGQKLFPAAVCQCGAAVSAGSASALAGESLVSVVTFYPFAATTKPR